MTALTKLEQQVRPALELVNNAVGRVGAAEITPVLESFKVGKKLGYFSGAGGEWRLSPRGALTLNSIRDRVGIL